MVNVSMLWGPRMQVRYTHKEVKLVNLTILQGLRMQIFYLPKEIKWSTQVRCDDWEWKYVTFQMKLSIQCKYVAGTKDSSMLHP